MIFLIVIFIVFFLFAFTPLIMIGLSKVFCATPFSYREGLILWLQILVIGVIFQLLQFAIITWLPPPIYLLNIILSIVSLVVIITLIRNKFYTTFPKAILIQIINIVLAIAVAISFRHFIVQAYKIPAGSNLPTILIGDYILVNKYIYRFENTQKNDWIIFKFPKDEKIDYIKRVVALPGDEVEIIDKKLYVNHKPSQEPFIANPPSSTMDKFQSPRDNFGPVTVPQDAYFVLGDNRDNSFDSRFWGFVQKEKIKGRAEIIYFSQDNKTKIIRFDRIGMKIK